MHKFFDQDDLLDRLLHAQQVKRKKIVFVLGSPLTAPHGTSSGVSGVEDIVNSVRAEFANDKNASSKLDHLLASDTQHPYQSAFEFLIGRRGQTEANQLIRRAVLKARKSIVAGAESGGDSALERLEKDVDGWALPNGVKALGEICTQYQEVFGNVILTTNFDPLIEIAIDKCGGGFYTSMTHGDGNIAQTTSSGTNIVHLHGFWRGSDTLHTPQQLASPRVQLQNSLSNLIKNSLVVVLAYGGWDDVITQSLSSAVADDTAYPEIIWAFYSSSSQDIEVKNAKLLGQLQPGILRGRVNLYQGIDCHNFLPILAQRLSTRSELDVEPNVDAGTIIPILTEEQEALVAIADVYVQQVVDAFPKNDLWYGREEEIRALTNSTAQLISISGMGGQGKSALASTFMNLYRSTAGTDVIVDWRDCREQSSTIHQAVAGALVRLGGGALETLTSLSFTTLSSHFAARIAKVNSIIVFDNIDQYVDLETGSPLDQLAILIKNLTAVAPLGKILFTSRPRIYFEDVKFQEIPLTGLNDAASKALFEMRSCRLLTDEELAELMNLTHGHPLWISFIAAQCNATSKLPSLLLGEIRSGKGNLPENTMRATWKALSGKGQQLLRVLAELERPEKLQDLDGLAGMRWNQLQKGFTNLDKMNLIVHKQQENGNDLIDLHPLVRSFVRREFPKKDRQTFIGEALSFIQSRLDRFSKLTGVDIPFEVLDIWLHKIELHVNQQDFPVAIETLNRVHTQLEARGLHEDFLRLSKRIMQEIDWSYAIFTYTKFDTFVAESMHVMVALDGEPSTEKWIKKYESSISGRGLHYINLCEIRSYVNWFVQNFEDAIHWAELGVGLKKGADVDTPYDCAHTLALARRDSGRPDDALEYFLYGENLEECLRDNIESQRDGVYYGNIGRCLFLMGSMNDALRAYKKVAQLFETNGTDVLNQGFIRFWVGQVMHDLTRVEDALFFYLAAVQKWEAVAPTKVAEVQSKLDDLLTSRPELETLLGTPIWKAEKRFSEWSRAETT